MKSAFLATKSSNVQVSGNGVRIFSGDDLGKGGWGWDLANHWSEAWKKRETEQFSVNDLFGPLTRE